MKLWLKSEAARMRIKTCTIYALRIPFVETFAHSAKSRGFSDSIVVRLESQDGHTGYGEGVARAYVTGETVETSIEQIRKVLWPAIAAHDYEELMPDSDPLKALAPLDESLPSQTSDGVIAFNAARAAVEIALVDCLLRSQKISLAEILPPRRSSVTYSGVISSGSIENASARARQFKLFGIREIKIKIVDKDGIKSVRAVRDVLGDEARLRVDANGAFNAALAIEVAEALAPFKVEIFEQPVARKRSACELREVRMQSPIPVMADESLVTEQDARSLIEMRACDYFNLRLSKCGGFQQTLSMARMAEGAGVRMQLGSQVGETAILSAAGRHLAAHLDDLSFVEGSYGKLLLTEDVSRDPLHFGHAGFARTLRGPGLGIQVREDVLRKYARTTIHLGEDETNYA